MGYYYLNGETVYYYDDNEVSVAVFLTWNRTYGKHFQANILIGNKSGSSFNFHPDKITAIYQKNGSWEKAEVYTHDEYMKKVTEPERKLVNLRGTVICEVNPKGEVVWDWKEYEHLDVNRYSKTDNLVDWTHTNTAHVLPENQWYKQGHKAFKPGNILACQRHFDTAIIIDRETKEIVWSYTGDYRGGLGHPHEPLMIPPDSF